MSRAAPSAETPDAAMTLEARVEGDRLVLRHAVINAGSEPIYLLNQLGDYYGLTGDPALDLGRNRDADLTPTIAFMNVGSDHDAVFMQGDVALPAGVLPTVPRVALATRLEPGATYRGAIRAPLPLREWHAYAPPSDADAAPVEVWRVVLWLAYRRAADAADAFEHESFPGCWVATGMPTRRVEAAAELTAPCVAWRRRGRAARFV
jgi:hypothetical protein